MALVNLSLHTVTDLVVTALTENGASRAQAAAIAESVTACERDECKSHGLFHLPGYLKAIRSGRVVADAEPSLEELTPVLLRVDAARGFAPLAHEVGRSLLSERAKRFGLAALGLVNCHHFEALWPELEPYTREGLGGFSFRSATSCVAPAGGTRPVLGTNPLAFAWPRAGRSPLIFDLATSAIARGEIQLRALRGESIPEGWAIDREGHPTTDPAAGLAGAQLPFGGYKGTALAIMADLLAGPLIGERLGLEATPLADADGGPGLGGEIIFVFDPARFCPNATPEAQLAHAERLFERIASDPGEARLPGDRRYDARARSVANGVSVDRRILEAVRPLAGAATARLIDPLLGGGAP